MRFDAPENAATAVKIDKTGQASVDIFGRRIGAEWYRSRGSGQLAVVNSSNRRTCRSDQTHQPAKAFPHFGWRQGGYFRRACGADHLEKSFRGWIQGHDSCVE
jgi:hypothetical protein